MKIGDYVAWADTWEDETGSKPAGLVLEVEPSRTHEGDEGYALFLILYQHSGAVAWEYGSDLEVMFESR
tara:strand:- start:546 stop:752 length:207 start_codon:yes stop_codon:yes gene_type:complete